MARDIIKDLVYGHLSGGKSSVPVISGQAMTIKDRGGKFVYLDAATGRALVCVDGSTGIFGFIEASEDSTIVSGTVLNCIIDPTAQFRIGVNSGTLTAAMKGETCDLSVSSDAQGLQVDASAEDTVWIAEVDTTNQLATVMINTVKQRATGVV